MNRSLAAQAALLAVPVLLAGCGGGSSTFPTTAAPAAPSRVTVSFSRSTPRPVSIPKRFGLSADGKTVYAGLIGANTLVGFDTQTLTRKTTVNVPASTGIVSDGSGNLYTTTAPWYRNQLVGGGVRSAGSGGMAYHAIGAGKCLRGTAIREHAPERARGGCFG